MPLANSEALISAVPGAVARSAPNDKPLRATLLRRAQDAVIDFSAVGQVDVGEFATRLVVAVAGDEDAPDAPEQAVLALHYFLVRVLAAGAPAPASLFRALKPMVLPRVDAAVLRAWLSQQLAGASVRAEFA